MEKKLKLGLLALFMCASTATFADDSFQWHGYMRGSMGMDTDFANLNKVDEEVHTLGRYGSEYDNFINSSLSKRWTDDKGQWAQYNFSFSVFDYSNEYTNPTNDYGLVNTLDASDSYVEMGGLNFLPKDSSIWLGKRRVASGIDLLDLDYKKISGQGFGFSSKSFDIGLYKELDSGDMGEYADIVAIDATYKLQGLSVEGTFTKATVDSTIPFIDSTKKGDSSVSILAEYKSNNFIGTLPGNTKYRAQFGKGVTADKLNMSVITDEKDTSYRFTVDGTTMTKNWTLNTLVNLESSKDDSLDLKYSNLSVIARGTDRLTDNLSMIYEAGISNKTNINLAGIVDNNNDGTTYKLAAGPAIQLNTMPWIRPILRFSAEVIGGEKKVTGFDKENELRFGAQFETWF